MTRTPFAVEFDPSVVVTPEQIAAWERRRKIVTAGAECRRSQGFVYFMRCGEFVKIGVANNPQKRKKEIETANPFAVELLATIPGGQKREAELHRQFKSCRYRREWFVYGDDIKRFLANIKNLKD